MKLLITLIAGLCCIQASQLVSEYTEFKRRPRHQSPINIKTADTIKRHGDKDFVYKSGNLTFNDSVPVGSHSVMFKFNKT